MPKKSISAFVFSYIVAALSIISTLLGLIYSDFCYRGLSLTGYISQDYVTLIIGVPLLLITTWLAFKKSRRGYLVWLGCLGYFLYTYSGYAFGVTNNLLLINIAIFSFSLFALIKGLSVFDVEPINLWFSKETPTGTLAGYAVFIGLFLAYFWLSPLFFSYFSGNIPEYAAFLGNPSSIHLVFDLGIICPLALIAGFLIWKHRSWGYALISYVLFKGIAMGLVIIVNTWLTFKWEAFGNSVTLFFGFFTIFILFLSYVFFKNLREETIKSYHDRNSVTYF